MSLVIPSLGNPFSLGMLYNACSEKIIPGKTLWDAKVLDSAKKVAQQPSSNFEVYSKNTLEEKTQSLDVEASLKLSLMGGMIEIGGAGKYLNDERTSERQARVTLKYSCTSRFEQLTMEQIGSIQYPKVLDNNKATHVVTGITYGTDAFFVFDRSVTESEKTKNISGNMEAVIKAIPISGSASLDIKFKNKEETDKFECKFYGDLQLPSNPSNFQEAVNVYRELPKLIKGENGDNDKTIPKRIYLYPLSELDGGHLHIVHTISDDLISQVEEIMQSFSTMTMRTNDLLSNEICPKFVELKSQIQKFLRLIKRFKTKFSKDLAAILPKIRGQGAEEIELAELISSVHASPFNSQDMDKYLKGKNKETKQLGQYLKNIQKESTIEHLLPSTDGELGVLTSDFDIKHVVCFAFNVVSDSTAYTDVLEDYLATGTKNAKASFEEWFDNPAVSAELRSKSSKFIDFVHSNSCAEDVRFAVTDTNDETGASGPAIILFTGGSCEDYEPPGKPGTPSATTVDTNRVNLVWKKPETGADSIASYKIWFQECKEEETNPSSKSAAESSPDKVGEFHGTPTAETKYCIDNLSPGTKYEFWVQAVSDIKVLSVNSDKCCGNTTTEELHHPADQIRPADQNRPANQIRPVDLILPADRIRTYRIHAADDHIRPQFCPADLIDQFRPADEILKQSMLVEPGPPQVYKLLLNILSQNKEDGFYKYSIGKSNSNLEKVLILFGAEGAGKSTLINGMANYVMGVKFEDTFRFKVVTDEGSESLAHSQTQTITAYTFYSTILDYNLTVIDIPGFGGTGGIERDKRIIKQIQMLFEGRNREGINVLHGIGFVTLASLARLTPTQKYMLDAILSMFGKDVVDNIFLLATFADGSTPLVLDALKTAKIPFQQSFKFNNSALFSPVDSHGSCFDSMFWKMGISSFASFFDKFNRAEAKSLTSTREVLKERQLLETLILGLHLQVKVGLNLIDAIEQEKNALKLAEKKQQLDALEREIYPMIKKIQESKESLSELALKPNPITETDYLELLISSEEQELKTGWKERVKQYHILLKEADILKKISNMEIKGHRHTEMFQMMWSSFKSSTTGN